MNLKLSENEIKTQINSFDQMKANIIEEKNNLARIAEKLNETKEKLDAKEQRLSYATKFLKQQENKLQQWKDNLTHKAKKLKKEREILMHDKEWNEILKESRRARTCQIGKALNNKHIWINDIISTIDREITDSPLPEGEDHSLDKRDRTLLIDNLIKNLKSKLETFPDNINIRLTGGETIYKPYPAYYTGYNNNEGTIHFLQAIYWQGTVEIILTEDITVNSSVIFSEGQILGKLKNKRLMYTREIPLPLKLVIGILNGNNEVPEFKIHSWDEKLISWRKGNFSAPLDWFNKFKSIISNDGIEGLVESDWITNDIANFINRRVIEKRKEKRLAANKPFNFLADEFDRIIDQE